MADDDTQAASDTTAIGADPAPGANLADPTPLSAAQRLRAFEDKLFGTDAVRINGHVERGSGSLFQSLTGAQRRHLQALEALVPAEQRCIDAEAEVVAAENAYAAALDAVEQSNEEISA